MRSGVEVGGPFGGLRVAADSCFDEHLKSAPNGPKTSRNVAGVAPNGKVYGARTYYTYREQTRTTYQLICESYSE